MIGENRIAVVIPAYRAADTIAAVVQGLPAFVDTIIVVDDASPDTTAEAALATRDPRLVCVRRPRNGGVGAAMADGFAQALAIGVDIVVKMDADGQMDPRALPQLLAPVTESGCDYAKGNRFYDLNALARMPWARRCGNAALSFLTKMASGYWNVYDPQNGFIAIRADMLRRLDLASLDRGYFFENSMLIQLNVLNARVAEVPMPARYGDERSSMRLRRILFAFPRKLFFGCLGRLRLKYFGLDFSPIAVLLSVGTLLVVGGVSYGACAWISHAARGAATPAGTVMVSALPVLFGGQLLLQALLLDIAQTPPGLGIQRIASRHAHRAPESEAVEVERTEPAEHR